MVSQITITVLIITMCLSVLIPIFLFFLFKKKYDISMKVVLFGALTFILFVQILEGIINGYILNSATMASFIENAWVFIPYTVFMAGIFEEVGRYIMMRFALKRYRKWKDGLAFGIGHGGVESIFILGLSNLSMIIFAFQINAGTFDQLLTNDSIKEVLMPIKEQLIAASPYMMMLGPVERLCAIALHIALSILVLYGVKSKKIQYLVYAVLAHAVFNLPAAFYQAGLLSNVLIIELLTVLFTIIILIFVFRSGNWFKQLEE
ncbi:YhfC family intramembrane metalloprotease [Virgibacillus alimentarius]|uniref:YhfC family intramembrane metalloprotease n=1 Tax=Virgibacillus alimentarius TaxID=698769 RepID=UPI00049303A4|nr:YhfC family intramembrane metalloprotease [Virgibacillus alimentarius]